MNLQQLEYFKTICETKNFTAASNVLSVTQPALSKSISKLEEELDVILFEREGRNINVTKYGEAFFKYAECALNEIERGKEKLKYMKEKNKMIISIGSTYCIGATFMPYVISSFLNDNLNVKFNFNTELKEEILMDLKNEKIELGFVDNFKDTDYPELEAVLVKKEEFVLIVPKNHHLSNREEVYLKDLKDEYFIAYNEQGLDKNISYSEIIGYTPKISVQPNQSSMLGGLVAAGAGIAIILNTPLINTNKISVIKIKDDIGSKSIYMVWNKNSKVSKDTLQFKNYILNFKKNE